MDAFWGRTANFGAAEEQNIIDAARLELRKRGCRNMCALLQEQVREGIYGQTIIHTLVCTLVHSGVK